jgi:hypothetical protein
MNIPKIGRAAGWGVAGVLAVAMGTGAAFAADGGGTVPPNAAATSAAVGKHGEKAGSALARWGKRLEHADAVIRTKSGPKDVLIQRGQITALDGSSMTVRSADGWSGSWTLTSATHYRADGSKASMSALKVGDRVFVAGPGQGHSGSAQVVLDPGPKPASKAPADPTTAG